VSTGPAMTTLDRRSLLSLALLSLGCRRSRAASAARAAPAPATIPARRIVSLSPTATESLVALGFGDRLVGVSALCHGPAGLPHVGTMVAPNVAAILALRPDALVGVEGPIATTTLQPVLETVLRRVFPPAETYEQYVHALDAYAALVGAPPAAATLRQRLTDGAARVERAVAGRARPKVLMVCNASPLVVAGAGSWVDSVLRAAGGDNAAQSPNRYPLISPDQVIAWAPSIVVDLTAPESTPTVAAAIAPLPDDAAPPPALPPIVRVDGELVRRQGPRYAEAVAAVARALHPGVAL
jgi:iron complex transport system substrate-binding protein